MTVFWDVAPCSLIEIYRRYSGAYCLHHNRSDDEGSMYLWNVGKFLPDYMAQHPRRQPSLYLCLYWVSCPATRHGGVWGEGGGTAPTHDLSTRSGWVVSVTPRPRFTTPGTHWIWGWMGLRADLDTETKKKNPLPLSGIEPRSSSP
jgi:hypothetical protein